MTQDSDRQEWQILSETELVDRPPYLRLTTQKIELPNGQIIDDYNRLYAQDHSAIVAINDFEQILCYRQYKHGPGIVTTTLAGGGIEVGETPLDAAKRELLEETGYTASHWTPLNNLYTSANYRGSLGHFFLAQSLSKISEPTAPDMEGGHLVWIDRTEIEAMLDGAVPGFDIMGVAAGVAMGLLRYDRVKLKQASGKAE